MKTITVRLPDPLARAVESEASRRRISKSDLVRECLQKGGVGNDADPLADIADLIGSVEDGLPEDLSSRVKHYLREKGFGRDRRR